MTLNHRAWFLIVLLLSPSFQAAPKRLCNVANSSLQLTDACFAHHCSNWKAMETLALHHVLSNFVEQSCLSTDTSERGITQDVG